jgi:hypothetical protein
VPLVHESVPWLLAQFGNQLPPTTENYTTADRVLRDLNVIPEGFGVYDPSTTEDHPPAGFVVGVEEATAPVESTPADSSVPDDPPDYDQG